MAGTVFETSGYCPVCEADAEFVARHDGPIGKEFHSRWFRGGLKCQTCGSVPRERALAHVINNACPDWRDMKVHECSPSSRGVSLKLRRDCPQYVTSQYNPDMMFGDTHPTLGWRNENLENQTFEDESFDLVVTQDVFEHLFHPGKAAREIARTLKPGGFCIMTVPVVSPFGETRRRAALENGEIVHLQEEQYHGNPVGDGRSLVTVDWSYDISTYLSTQSGMGFSVLPIDDMNQGIRDYYNVVLLARKNAPVDLGEGTPA